MLVMLQKKTGNKWKIIPQMRTKYPNLVLSLSMECLAFNSVLAASTLIAMQHGLFSPFKQENTNKNEESLPLGRRSSKKDAPPMLSSFHPSNPVCANIFSPSYLSCHLRMQSMTPKLTMPLAAIFFVRFWIFHSEYSVIRGLLECMIIIED